MCQGLRSRGWARGQKQVSGMRVMVKGYKYLGGIALEVTATVFVERFERICLVVKMK